MGYILKAYKGIMQNKTETIGLIGYIYIYIRFI